MHRLWLAAARRAGKGSAFHHGEGIRRTTEVAAYDAWRAEALVSQVTDHFDASRLRGRDVLDFGCGSGELTVQLATRFGCRSVVGIDLDRTALDRAEHKAAKLAPQDRERIRLRLADDDRRIAAPDSCVDIICCFDVLEHIPHVAESAAEWRRVLRPGGEVWIWWSPWRGPYGHHVESLVPLPWVHLLLPARTIFAVCADIYDDPAFVPRHWDIDPATGARRPNRWRGRACYEPFLNRLTQGQFERVVGRSGLAMAERKIHGFRGSRAARMTCPLTLLPGLGEWFVSFFTYRLCKPVS
jgi:SAM-dependent methyltransferase